MVTFDAVLLAGGRSRRMGVADKTRLTVAGLTLLDRALAAVAEATTVVAVGEARPVAGSRQPVWTREDPPGSGPAAALAAGVGQTRAGYVVVLAGDLPLVTAAHVTLLLAAAATHPAGAVTVDREGHPQWLCSAWRRAALVAAPLHPDASLRSALGPLDPVPVPGPRAALDCDTPDDLRRARQALAAH